MPLVALAPVVIAIALLLIWFAAQQLHFPAFNAIAHNVPAVGGLILRAFLYAIDWAVYQAEQAVNDAVGAIKGLIWTPVHWLETHVGMVVDSFYRVGLALERITRYTIPQLAASLLATINADLSRMAGYVNAQVGGVYTWAQGQFNGVYHYVGTEIALADGYAQQLFTAAQAYAAAGIQADAKYAAGLFTEAITYTDAQTSALTKWVEGEIGAVTTWTGGEISALSRTLAADYAQAITYAGALAAPIALDLARLKAECTDNLCANLGGLANVLGALAGDLGLAGLILLAGEMAHDPKGTATAVREVASPVATAAAGAMRAAAGF